MMPTSLLLHLRYSSNELNKPLYNLNRIRARKEKRGERRKESGTAKSHETDSRTPRRKSTKFDLSRLFLNQIFAVSIPY